MSNVIYVELGISVSAFLKEVWNEFEVISEHIIRIISYYVPRKLFTVINLTEHNNSNDEVGEDESCTTFLNYILRIRLALVFKSTRTEEEES